MNAISAEGLNKSYSVRSKGKVRALSDVSFGIREGELVGYIGPNGAGKSTTVKILSGILVPDSGKCEVLGLCPWKQRVRHAANIGVVFGQRSQLWWDLPVIDSFKLLRDIYRLSKTDYNSSLSELCETLSITTLLDQPVRQLSLGQRMKCELAASLLHKPRVLFLDEPTIGLDAVTKLAVRDFIKYINASRGVTAILTTHDMDDIEALCSRVMLIGAGELLMDGTIDDLRHGRDERVLKCKFEHNGESVAITERVISAENAGGELIVRFDPEMTSAAKLIAEINAQSALRDVTVENTPIERIIASIYTDMAAGNGQ